MRSIRAVLATIRRRKTVPVPSCSHTHPSACLGIPRRASAVPLDATLSVGTSSHTSEASSRLLGPFLRVSPPAPAPTHTEPPEARSCESRADPHARGHTRPRRASTQHNSHLLAGYENRRDNPPDWGQTCTSPDHDKIPNDNNVPSMDGAG